AEVTDLVGVDDGADGPDRAAHDVEGDDRDDEAVEIADDGARLAVDPGRLEAEVQAPVLVGEGAEQMHHAVAPVDRLGQRRGLAAAVADEHGVLGDEVQQRVDVALAKRGEELVGDLTAPPQVAVKARAVGVKAAPGPPGDLAAPGLAAIDDRADLVKAIAEDVVQEQDG